MNNLANKLMLIAAGILMLAGVPSVEITHTDISNISDIQITFDSILYANEMQPQVGRLSPVSVVAENAYTYFLGLLILVAKILALIAAAALSVKAIIDVGRYIVDWVKTWDDWKDWLQWGSAVKRDSGSCVAMGGIFHFTEATPQIAYCKTDRGQVLATYHYSFFQKLEYIKCLKYLLV